VDPRDLFAQFFGTANPFAAEGDDGGSGGGGGGGGPFGGMMGGVGGSGMSGGGFPPGFGGGPRKAEPTRVALQLSLEELFTGAVKHIKVTRARLGPDRRTARPEEKTLEIAVKPGWKRGTTVTFEGEGDEAPGALAPDVQFIIGEKPHARFVRDGNDLVLVKRVTLAEALCGTALEVPTLDGRTLSLAFPEVITPGAVKVVKGEGMPVSKDPGKRGNLLVKFEVAFPAYVPDAKKAQLRALLT
jgi:DnaJ-class molecular chaperone